MSPLHFAETHGLAVPVSGSPLAEIRGAYCCGLLSLAMVRAKKGDAVLTVAANVNAIAVAVMAEASCVILCEGFHFDQETLTRAREHGLWVLETDAPIFETAALLAKDLGLC